MYNLKLATSKYVFGLLIAVVALIFAVPTFAHVVVKPGEVGIASYQTFSIGVPNEKDNPVVKLRLVIPSGLESVSPNVKPGWNIEVKKAGEGMKGEILNTGELTPDPETVTEIVWTGGSIPAGQRDEFLFSAKTPANETELKWLAYQTYSDGTEVAWDMDPNTNGEEAESENSGPYSKTEVVNDLKSSPPDVKTDQDQQNQFPVVLSVVAIAIAAFALVSVSRKK